MRQPKDPTNVSWRNFFSKLSGSWRWGRVSSPERRGCRARAWVVAALTAVYVLVPNYHHPLLAGVPLSIAATGALILALALFVIGDRIPRPVTWGLVALVVVKLVVAGAFPARGFEAAYFASDRFEGPPYARVDRRLDFHGAEFPLQFFNDHPFWGATRWDDLPFAARWRATVALPEPTTLALAVTASGRTTVSVDGGGLPAGPLVGTHEIVVTFVRDVAVPPSLTVIVGRAGAAGEIPVFSGPVTPAGAGFLALYASVAGVFDLLVWLALALSVTLAVARAFTGPRADRWLPPFPVAALGVVAFWFVVGAIRTGPRFATTEFFQRGNDWLYYEMAARHIVAGDVLGGPFATYASAFLYPYFIAVLHLVFGPHIWPVYFGQYLALALACVAYGMLARTLWSDREGLGVLLTTCILGVLDTARWYMVTFLPENLAILVVPAVFLAVHPYLGRPSVARGALVGLLLGVMALTRFNLLPFVGIAAVYLLALRPPRPGAGQGRRFAPGLAMVLCFVVVFALFPLREHSVSGAWTLVPSGAPMTYATQKGSLLEQLRTSWLAPIRNIVLPNAAFILGYPKFAYPLYAIRPHWFVLWMAYVAWIWSRRHQRPPPMIWLLHLYVVIYLGVMLPNAYIWSYGYRYLVPLVLVLGLFVPGGLMAIGRGFREAWGRATHGPRRVPGV